MLKSSTPPPADITVMVMHGILQKEGGRFGWGLINLVVIAQLKLKLNSQRISTGKTVLISRCLE